MAEKHFEVELPEDVLAGFGSQESQVPHKVREAGETTTTCHLHH